MLIIPISLDPVLLALGPFQLGWHGLFTALALLAGLQVGIRRAVNLGMSEQAVQRVTYWGVAGGIVGARLFHVADHLSVYQADPLQIFAIWSGGIAVYGGFVGGVLAGAVAAGREGLPRWPLADAAAPGLLIGQALGRIGCLINGDAWGAPTSGPLGLVYTHPDALLPSNLLGVPTQPYPLYEILGVGLVILAVWMGANRLRNPGSTFVLAVLSYSVIRFTLSFMRQEQVLLWGMQEAQLIAIGTAILTSALFFVQRRGSVSTASI